MSKTNIDICHDFFYNEGGRYRPCYKNIGYSDNTFFSYDTAIARIMPAHNGERVCLISYDGYSRTTGRQLSYLRSACPLTILNIPTNYGSHYIDEDSVVTKFFADLNFTRAQKLTQAAYRDQFMNIYRFFKRFLSYFHDYELSQEQEKLLEEYEELYNTLNSSDGVKKLKEKQRQEAARKAKEFKELCKNNSITELARNAYSRKSVLTSDEKAKLIKQINPDGLFSYVWQGDELYYHTSQNVWVTKKEGDLLLKLLHANKLKHGYRISYYTVVSVTNDHVKIGCHLIPRQNLEELFQKLVA